MAQNEYLSLIEGGDSSKASTTLTGPSKSNPYMQLLDDDSSRLEQQFQASTRSSVGVNPDLAAQERQRAKELNVPTPVVTSDPKGAENAYKAMLVDRHTQDTPNLRSAFTDPSFAQVAHDDSSTLSSMEKIVGKIVQFGFQDAPAYIFGGMNDKRSLAKTVTSGFYSTMESVGGLESAIVDPLAAYESTLNGWLGAGKGPLQRWADSIRAGTKYAGEQAKVTGSDWGDTAAGRIFGGGFDSGLQSAGQTLGTAVASSYLLGPEVGIPVTLVALASLQGGKSFADAKEKGLGYFHALAYGLEDAVAEWAGEKYLGLAGFMSKVAGGASLKQLVGYEILREVPGEIGTTLWQNFNQWANINPQKSFGDWVSEQPEAIAQTIVATVVGGTAQVGAAKGLERAGSELFKFTAEGKRAEAIKGMLETMNSLTEESKLAARDREVFQAWLEKNTDGTPVQDLYIDGNVLLQSGLVNQLAEVSPTVAEQLQAGQVTPGGSVRIPTSEFVAVTANTPLNQALIDHVKADPNGYTFAESEQYKATFDAEMQAKLENHLQAQEMDDAFKAEHEQLRADFLNQLNNAKRHTSDVNEAYATFLSNFYAVTAARIGTTPQALYNTHQLYITNQSNPNAVLTQNQSQFKNWFGDSKVVDSNGRPVVYYHATDKDFDTFNTDPKNEMGAHFGTAAQAKSFGTKNNGRTIPVYLSIKNPYEAQMDLGTWGDVERWKDYLYNWEANGNGPINPSEEEIEALKTPADVRKLLESRGFDGIEYYNQIEGEFDDFGDGRAAGNRAYIAFNPAQIRSAIGGENALNQTPMAIPEWALEGSTVEITDDVKKNAISLSPKATLAGRNYEKLDKIFEQVPNPLESEEAWRKFMSLLVADDVVVGVPYQALEYAQNPQALADYLTQMRSDQLESRRSGFALGAAIREQYINGSATAQTTGRLLLWAMLSRKAGAYPHESAYMDLVNGGVDEWIDKAVNGTWTDADTVGFTNWSSAYMATKKDGVSPGAGVTSNANDFGRILLTKMSAKGASGKTLLSELHDMMADPNVSTDQIRRAFFALGDGLGIQNKVLSFALLVTGRWDTLVLDRVQFTHLWGDQYKIRAEQNNIYDGEGGGLQPIGDGHFGVAVYEALARGLSGPVAEAYRLAGLQENGDGTLGAFHWDSWLVESSQAIAHPTVEAIPEGQAPRPDLAVKQGKFDTFSHGFEYRADGQYQIPMLSGAGYQILSPAETAAFVERLREPKEGVVPNGFKVSQYKDKPWTEADGVNRARYDEILAEYGRRADASDVAPAGTADASGSVQGSAAAQAGGVLNQNQPTFYSALTRAIEGAKQAKAPASDWLSIITKMPGAAEIQWTGLDDFLAMMGKQQVTKDQILQFLHTNGVEVVDVLKHAKDTTPIKVSMEDISEYIGDTPNGEKAERVWKLSYPIPGENGLENTFTAYRIIDDKYERVVLYSENGNFIDEYSSVYDAQEYVQNDANFEQENYKGENQTEFGKDRHPSLELPGGTNYKELLLTLPLTARNTNIPELPHPEELYVEIEQMIVNAAKRSLAKGYIDQKDYDGIVADPYAYLYMAEEDLTNKYHLGVDDFHVNHAWPSGTDSTFRGVIEVNQDMDGRDIRISRALRQNRSKAFFGSHWSEPNVVSHIRFNDRTDAQGNRVLFIEELQSDWGQAGVKSRKAEVNRLMKEKRLSKEEAQKLVPSDFGFGDPDADKKAEKARLAWENYVDEVLRPQLIEKMKLDYLATAKDINNPASEERATKQAERFVSNLSHSGVVSGLDLEDDTREQELHAEMNRTQDEAGYNKLPAGPFVADTKAWLNLSLKRVIRYAAENGYDKVAFVNGKQSADRYSLSHVVDEIEWSTRKEGGKLINMVMSGGNSASIKVDSNGIVEWYKGRILGESLIGKDLDEVLGKDMSEKIMAEENNYLSGANLDVGGKGMINFYDKIVPQAVGSIIKKMDGTVAPVDFNDFRGKFTVIDSKTGQEAGRFATVEEANSFMEQAKSAQKRGAEMWFDANNLQHQLDNTKNQQLGFTVTDKMRDVAMQGQSLFQPGQQQEPPRGQIFFGNDMTRTPSVIALLEKADLSTFIHESGHFFLQMQADLAMRIQMQISSGAYVSDGEREIVDDMNKILDWFGIKGDENLTALDKWASMSLNEQREYHEKWARGFEAYAFEGNAPTAELQGIFQRFSAWMLGIYKSLKNLNVELTDEVRGVMDRMLATRDQIEAAEMARNMGPLFNAQNGQGFIDDWQAYHNLANSATAEGIDKLQAQSLKNMQWASRAKARFLKMMQKEHDEVRADVRREVTREVMSQPLYQLWQFLTSRQGEEVVPGVTELTNDTLASMRGKLRTSVLKEMYGNEADAAWRTLTRLRMTKEDGIHPEVLAEFAGFDSADAMIKALIGATPPAQVIDAMTDQRMLERHGELVDPKAREQAADEAVHNEMRIKMLQAEARALEKAMNVRQQSGVNKNGRKVTYAVLPQAAKQFATRLIGQLRVRDIRASQYTAAAAKAGKEAERAFGAGELEKAAEQKRNQIINTYAAKEAFQALREIKSMVAYMRKFDKKSKGLDYGYYEQIVGLLERYDLVTSTSLKEIDKRTSLRVWLDNQEAMGIKPDIADELIDATERKHYKNATVDELRGLFDTIKQLEHLGRLKQKLLTAADQRDFNEVRDRMTESILANADGRKIENRTPYDKLGKNILWLKQKGILHMKAAQLARIMDGGKDGGPVWEYLIRTANERGNWETSKRADATQALMAVLAPILTQERGKLQKAKFYASIGMSLNKENVLAIALNMGNASNIQRLLGGEGWTIDQIKPVLDTLTAADWNFVQSVWDHFETYRPLIAEKEKRVYGKEPKWIDAQELIVQTSDGQELRLRGGYFPVKYDPRASMKASQHDAAEQAKIDMRGAYTSATTRRSFTKERASEVKDRPLLYTFDAIYSGINEVIHDLAWNEWLIDANRILANPKISDAIRETMGHDVWTALTDWVKDIAVGERKAQSKADEYGAFIRQGVSMAGLAFNVMSALLQPIGLTNSWSRIGGKWVALGIKRAIANPIELSDQVSEMSEFMRNRSLNMMRELSELRDTVNGRSKLREKIDTNAYLLMTTFQHVVDLPTWWGAFEKAKSEGNTDERAISLADQAVIDSQGSGMIKDLSALERGGALSKLFTVFYSFMNTTLNQIVEKSMTTKSKAELAKHLMLLMVMPPILNKLIKDALTPGDSGDWEDPETAMLTILKEIGMFAMGMVVIIREFSGIFDAFGGSPTGDYKGPAGLRIIPDSFALAKQIGQGNFDDGLRKAAINLAGDIFKLPSAQINKTITGIEALQDGEADSAPEAVGLVLFGQQKPHK